MLLFANGSVKTPPLEFKALLDEALSWLTQFMALLSHSSEPVQDGRTPNPGIVGQGRRPTLTSTASRITFIVQ